MAVLLVLLILLALAAPAAADEVPAGYTYSHAWLESADGTQLHAGVFLPAGRREDERHPVLMTITPYTAPNGGATSPGNTDGPVIRFPELFSEQDIGRDRWAYVQVDVRGFGGSGGCFEYYGPNEMADARAAVQWAADADWSTGRVGLWGKSYDAASEVLALAARPRGLAATVIQAPGLSAYTALWMNRNHYFPGRFATTGAYVADDLLPPQNPDTLSSPEYAVAASAGLTSPPTCRTDALAQMNVQRDRDSAFWRGREPYLGAAGSDVPTFWSHGFWDANTKPVHLPIWTSLGGPRQAWFGQFTHLRGHESGVGRRGFLAEAFRFLDRHVRGVEAAEADPPVTVQQGDGTWRAEGAWPPADAAPWKLPLARGDYRDSAGNTATDGGGLWTVTPDLPHAVHLAGEPALAATVETSAPEVNVVAHLYDVDPAGTATLVTRGAATLAADGRQAARFALYPQDWRFEAGHRIALRLSGSDDGWFFPGATNTRVTVAGGGLDLPLLRYRRDAVLAGGASDGNEDPLTWKPSLPAPVEVVWPPALEPMPESERVPGGRPPSSPPSGPAKPELGIIHRPVVPARRTRPTVRLRVRGRRLIVSGRARARRVRLTLRFGGVKLSTRTVRVRSGAYRASFPIARLKRGRIRVTARAGGRKRSASLRLRR